MKSTHIPEFAGDIVSVTGSLVVDTGLREIQSATVSLAEDSITDDEEAIVSWKRHPTDLGKMTIYVWKSGPIVAGGTAGDSPVDVSWMALGK